MRVEISFRDIFKATATEDGWECDIPAFKKQLEEITRNADEEYIGYQPVRSKALKLAKLAERNFPGVGIVRVIDDSPQTTKTQEGRVY